MRKQHSMWYGIDWLLVGLFLLLMVLGWFNIYAAVYNSEHQSIFDISQKYGKQLLWIAGALLLALIMLILDPTFYSAFAYPIYAFWVFMCAAVIFLGREISGSHSWFRFGDFGIQPAEFAKFAVCMALSKYLSSLDIKMQDLKTKIISALIILVPMGIVILENETGTALVYAAFVFVMYREGLSGNFLLIGFFTVLLSILALLFDKVILLDIVGGAAIVLLFFFRKVKRVFFFVLGLWIFFSGVIVSVDYAFAKLEPHQKTRINVFLGKEQSKESNKKELWNINQSLIAIGSGGVSGKGYLQGMQTKYKFVPEQATDFIFCTVGEEWGFAGSAFILLLFLALILRIVWVAERQRSIFSRIYGYGVASIFFFHLTVNVGMTIGLAPVIGIPLPFFSYGGSSLWAFTVLLFIFIKLDSQRMEIFR